MPFGGLLTLGLISAGGAITGAAINAHASGDAADKQAASSQAGIDYLKQEKEKEREAFAPYAEMGGGALSKLGFGLGIGSPTDYDANGMPATPPGGSPGSLTPVGDPKVSPKSPAGQFIANTKTQPVWMTSPNGERGQVPANLIQHYLELGAQLEPGQGLEGGSVPRAGSLAMIGRTPPPGSGPLGIAAERV
jgi:hypothetical protein